jgi:hypothetical protein
MRKSFLSLLLSLFLLSSSAQKVYFIYLQTESEQPFFVRMNNKVYSSSASGYLILSKLVDSTYQFTVGFPQNKWPDQHFSVALNRQDHGYLLKNFDTKGWGLFHLQSMAVLMATGKSPEEKAKEGKDASFTDILAKAADDPTLKDKPVQPKTEEKKPEIVKEVVKKEEPKVEVKEPVVTKPIEVAEVPVVKKEEPKTAIKEPVVTQPVEIKEQPVESRAEIKEEPVVTTDTGSAPYKISQVKRWSESSTTEGFGLVFIDEWQNGIKDTIRLVIPHPKTIITTVKEEPKVEKKFLEITEAPVKEEVKVITEEKTAEEKPVVSEPVMGKVNVKNNCGDVATESDFFKLRKKMAAEEKEDDMIAEAKKYFKIKCFSSGQLKNLSALFLTDEGKYNFFDLSYKYVSDADVFPSLQSELKDEYYSSRFRAMLRN